MRVFRGTATTSVLKETATYEESTLSQVDKPVNGTMVTIFWYRHAIRTTFARFFGGGIQVAPHARIDDGQFDVTVWSGFSLRDFVFQYHALFDGSHVENPRTLVRRAQYLHATSDEQVLLDVDGENPGRLPASFTIIPRSLRIKM